MLFSPIVRRSAFVVTLVVPMLLAACSAPPKPPAEAVAVVPAPPPPPPVMPVEAEPMAPATQPALVFTQLTQGPVAALLAYADRVRPLGGNELAAELARLGEPGDAPLTQMQVALVLAQTRVPADLVRAIGLMQRVAANPSADAQPLQPLARALAARYQEQRRVEDDRERQAQQLRDSQRRIDQLNDRIEALRAIERSFSRPNSPPPAAPVPSTPKPAP
ncbi:hypothetical protein SAMN05444679_104249 [Variovorax sp. CF079]|jgi:hypothetical protein|uniref:hypothetical protein n=1 Tax=Variovorax sp. CF079 TaxID=1882774 RepID=UPI00087F6387|nr:hypothetical protein [Variovorax sp. CF079]SDC66393.1 hypothetical protein SAMN05444679_104249 [Variovorax sp. CF079]